MMAAFTINDPQPAKRVGRCMQCKDGWSDDGTDPRATVYIFLIGNFEARLCRLCLKRLALDILNKTMEA